MTVLNWQFWNVRFQLSVLNWFFNCLYFNLSVFHMSVFYLCLFDCLFFRRSIDRLIESMNGLLKNNCYIFYLFTKSNISILQTTWKTLEPIFSYCFTYEINLWTNPSFNPISCEFEIKLNLSEDEDDKWRRSVRSD